MEWLKKSSTILPAIAVSVAMAAPVTVQADVTITTAGWNWSGSGDWFDPTNWQFGFGDPSHPAPGGSTTLLPVYVGPTEYKINGVSQGFYFPAGSANLSSDYQSPSLVMAAFDGISELTINNGATYTTTAVIGAAPANGYVSTGPVQAAVVNLDGGSIAGSWTFTENGRLNLNGGSYSTQAGVISGTIHNFLIASGASFEVDSTVGLSGTVNNSGVITFAGGSSRLEVQGPTTLQGGGEVIMVDQGSIIASGPYGLPNDELINVDHTIRGQGTLAGNIQNQHIIRAEGGELSLLPGTFDNTGGRVEVAADGVLKYSGGRSQQNFGDLHIETGGLVTAGSVFHNVNLVGAGPLVVANNNGGVPGLELSGTVNNSGVITFASGSSRLGIQGPTMLQGGGEIVMVDQGSYIASGSYGLPNDELINVDHTIRGQGTLAGNIQNQHIIRAEGGELSLLPGTFDNTGGRVEIASDGVLRHLGGHSQQNFGDLHIEIGGLVTAGSAFHNVNLVGAGPLVVANNNGAIPGLELSGTVNNSGVITFVGGSSRLGIQGPTTLQGGGEIVMVDQGSYIASGSYGLPNDELINVDHTIRGQGTLAGNIQNQHIIRAEGGELSLLPGTFDNTGGRVEIASDGVLRHSGGHSQQNFGDLHIETGGLVTAGSAFHNVNLVGAGPLVVANNNGAIPGLELSGTVNNSGVITFTSGSSRLGIQGPTTLQGGGEIVMVDQGSYMGPGSYGLPNDELINVDHTIRGQGVIASEIKNDGTIRAEGGNLAIYGNIEGQGVLEIADGSELAANGALLKAQALEIEGTGSLDFNGSRLEVVDIVGNFDHDTGTYAPGASPAVSTILGDYTMTGGILEIELGGLGLGEFDQLQVSGDTFLSGGLSLVFLDDFSLTDGLFFSILETGGLLDGQFTGWSEGDLIGNYGSDLFITYMSGDGNDIALYTSPVPLPPASVLFISALLGLLGRKRFSRGRGNI